jgi:hypothetical protein
MSELRARNVKSSKAEDKVSKGSSGAEVRLSDSCRNHKLTYQIKKNIQKVEQASYVRSILAVLGLLAVGFFGVKVSLLFFP